MKSSHSPLRIGIAGLGKAANLVLPWMHGVDGVRLTAGADTRELARDSFVREYRAPAFGSVEALCESPEVDAVWIETPTHLHCEHVIAAAERGKQVICAKPLATTLDECDRMIAACRAAGVRLLIGHSKIFDTPIQAMSAIVRNGRLGRLLKIDTWWFNDWLRRPRNADDVDEKKGGGFVLRQAPHLVDIALHVANSPALSVRAMISSPAADGATPDRRISGVCTAMIRFGSGAVASFTLNGYGYFESRELTWNIGVFGGDGRVERTAPGKMPFAGLTIASCEGGVIRQSPNGLYVYTSSGRSEEPVGPNQGRAAELIELRNALRNDRDVFPNGEWGRANLEICLAILRSAHTGRDIELG